MHDVPSTAQEFPMQTYTHALMGGVIGVLGFPQNPLAQISCVIASTIPDLTMVPQYAIDLIEGRQPMTEQSSRLMFAKEIGHSIPLWLIITLFGWFWNSTVLAIGLGGITHAIVDVLTHGTGPRANRPYWDTDLKFMWPTSIDLRPLGIWEYRIGYGVFRPKFPELVVMMLCISIIVVEL